MDTLVAQSWRLIETVCLEVLVTKLVTTAIFVPMAIWHWEEKDLGLLLFII